MDSRDKMVKKHHSLALEDWRNLKINGICDIRGFDESSVALESEDGRIYVEGTGLKIESLEKEGGIVIISGDISGVFRATGEKGKRGFFGKLFGG